MITQENIPYTSDEIKAMVKTCEKYNAALERASKLRVQNPFDTVGQMVEHIFPELKESKDEKMRKNLYKCLRYYVPDDIAEEYIEWLEKQREQQPASVTDEWIEDYWQHEKVNNPYSYDKDEEIQFDHQGFVRFCKKYCKKPADKIEPKFHEGEWCMDKEDGTIFQIVKVLDNTYAYKTNEGKEYSCTHYSLENDAKLWTIQDAKDGDVLASGQVVFIFKAINNIWLYCHCSAHNDGTFIAESYDILRNKYFSEVHPATKEQRDLLFRNMKEAGYDWDADKKELKKMEVASKESEDEKIRRALINGFKECLEDCQYPKNAVKYWHNVKVDNILAWLEKQGKQKTDPCTDCTNDKGCVTCENGNLKETKIGPKFKAGDEVYNKFDKSLGHVVIESVDDTTYYGDTTNFDITDQDQWGIVRSCENCKCGYYSCKSYPTVSCYLHEDCGGDGPIIISDDDFVETAMTCKEFEREN